MVCPVPDDNSTVDFDAQVFIDPSGTVVTTSGAPVTGATVTLLRSDDELGPFIPVPDGSTFRKNRRIENTAPLWMLIGAMRATDPGTERF